MPRDHGEPRFRQYSGLQLPARRSIAINCGSRYGELGKPGHCERALDARPDRRSPSDRLDSSVIGKQLDWVVETTHGVFAHAFEIEITCDEVGKGAGQQHRFSQLFGEGLET